MEVTTAYSADWPYAAHTHTHIHTQQASDAVLWGFFWCQPEQTVELAVNMQIKMLKRSFDTNEIKPWCAYLRVTVYKT